MEAGETKRAGSKIEVGQGSEVGRRGGGMPSLMSPHPPPPHPTPHQFTAVPRRGCSVASLRGRHALEGQRGGDVTAAGRESTATGRLPRGSGHIGRGGGAVPHVG